MAMYGVYKLSKEQVAAYQKMTEVMNAKLTERINGAEHRNANAQHNLMIPGLTDPTPDQLLEWMKEQLELYAECRASGNWNDLPLHFIPRIIDTVKRVTA